MQAELKKTLAWLMGIVLLGMLPYMGVLISDQLLFSSDQMGFPAWNWFFSSLKEGVLPLWNPYHLGGMPTFDAMSGDAAYPLFWLAGFLIPIEKVVSWIFPLHTVLAGLFAWVLARRFFGLRRSFAFLLAIAYMLNTNYISHVHAGHSGKFYIMSWLPLGLFFLLRCLQPQARWFHLLGLTLTTSVYISTSHLQFTYYVLIGYFLIWVYKIFWQIKEKNVKGIGLSTLRFWLPVLIGVGLLFPVFYPPTQWNKYQSVRGEGTKQTYEHATSWSAHPEEVLASLSIPEFVGIGQEGQNPYWGRNPFKLNSEYPGLLLLFLGVFSFAAFRRKWMWLWLGLGGLSIIFALGANTPIFHLFYSFVPGVKSFRAPSMIYFWLTIALFMIAGEGLRQFEQGLTDAKRAKLIKKSLTIGLGISGFLLFAGLFPGLIYAIYNSFISPQEIANFQAQAPSQAGFQMGAIRSAILLALMVLSVWKWGLKEGNWKPVAIALSLLCLADLFWVNNNFIRGYDFQQHWPKEAAIDYLSKDTTTFRVFTVPGSVQRGYMMSAKIEGVDDWADNEYRVFRAFRGEDYQGNPNFMAGLKQNSDGTVEGNQFLDMLNVKYLAFRAPDQPGLRLVENKSHLPRAWLVTSWKSGKDSLLLDSLKTPSFNPKTMAWLSNATPIPEKSSQDSAPALSSFKRNTFTANKQSWTIETNKAGIVVFSDIWMPFWKAEVNGKKIDMLRVNYALRGLYLNPGKYEIHIFYQSDWIQLGLKVALTAMILLLILLSVHAFAERKGWLTLPKV